MIRIFAPPTHDPFLRPDAVTAANLVLHIAVVVALVVPLGKVAKEEIFDRLVVFLVPPDAVGAREQSLGEESPISSAPVAAGIAKGVEAPPSDYAPIQLKGANQDLSAEALLAANKLLPGDNALTVLEVDSAVARDPLSASPEYPQHLLEAGTQGLALVRFVVDSTGAVDTMTYRVVTATHPDFSVAVRRALPLMRFRPAIQNGKRVRQLVEQPYNFRIRGLDTLTTLIKPPIRR
ncbi:MAG: TonB family protein [Gemmatimonadales bacterium]|nr:TonB family protein [Gemmatimonadales bacterium]